ncbi:hypothetical protein CJU90_2652 [Yarrowia sp. C11]|nr:hypothetical protein CKK34_4100 [Yarrowia sp. E02]KAG5369202.1 hypothetical protein CJU90_2652 [Yarrowia sp. C11]
MLFKSLTLLTAATSAIAAPAQDKNAPDGSEFILRLHPGSGSMGMKALQLRNNKVVFGLESNNTTVPPLQVTYQGDQLAVNSSSTSPGEITIASNGQLVITEASTSTFNSTYGWTIEGGGSFVRQVYYKGSQEFYSCTSEDGAVIGGQEVYILGSGNYTCDEPFKFTIGATTLATTEKLPEHL